MGTAPPDFTPRVETVADGIHVAIGFGLANTILVAGDGACVVVDTLGSVEAAGRARRALREVCDLPVAAVVYTHNHADHVMGARAFAEPGTTPIYAHHRLEHHVEHVLARVRPAIERRSRRQFGVGIAAEGDAGIGPHLETTDGTPGYLAPTRTVAARTEVEAGGVRLVLEPAPGETPDQLLVWLPDREALLPGDDIYRAFPNLYAIRGTAPRDVRAWIDSLDRMRELAPRHLVPSHTAPLSGRTAVAEVLTAYRDAIQFVHDQTVRGMNAGRGPDELAAAIRLPDRLADHPWLQPRYGTVPWSVRGIYAGYMGWFDGDPAHLDPHPPAARARRLAELAGGEAGLRTAARQALDRGDARWALELTSASQELGDAAAVGIRTAALEALAEEQTSANGANYLRVSAAELEGGATAPPAAVPDELLDELPLATFFAGLSVRLDAGAAAGTDLRVGFVFPDADERWGLHVRDGVAEVRPEPPAAPAAVVTLPAGTFKRLLVGGAGALADGDVSIDGDEGALVTLLGLFDTAAS